MKLRIIFCSLTLLLFFAPQLAIPSEEKMVTEAPDSRMKLVDSDKGITEGEQYSGIIYGENHSFMLTAPAGWLIDNKSGIPNGLYAVFYPVGYSWSNSTKVMYVNTANKGITGNETIEKVIEYDISQFKLNSPNLAVKDAEPLLTSKGKKAIVKYFSGYNFNNYEAIAYIDENRVVVLIVLSSRSKEDFEKSLPAFKELVNSYQFLTEDVKIKNK